MSGRGRTADAPGEEFPCRRECCPCSASCCCSASLAPPLLYGGGGVSGGSGGSGGMSHASAPSSPYTLTKLVGDMAGAAAQVDPHLVNAWGLVAGPSTPWWVSNNGTSSSTLYDGTGAVLPLVVTVPGAPTGIVFNGGSGFVISDGTNSGPATFIFATESGVISGWNHAVP